MTADFTPDDIINAPAHHGGRTREEDRITVAALAGIDPADVRCWVVLVADGSDSLKAAGGHDMPCLAGLVARTLELIRGGRVR